MTPEKEAKIRELSKTVAERRIALNAAFSANTWGLSMQEIIELQQACSIADALYWEAKTALDYVIRGKDASEPQPEQP